MSNLDSVFIAKIRNNCSNNISFIDEVASVLDISYDAAYRRITNKNILSLRDTIKLANHFNVSIDNLFVDKQQRGTKMLVSVSNEINNLESLENYFLLTAKTIARLQLNPDAQLIYSAKDLPLFYFLNDDLFAAFKIYTLEYLLNKDFPLKQITFEDFKIPVSLMKSAKQFSDFYQKINITEIWNNTILETTLNQILYFYELNLLSFKVAIKLCDKLQLVLSNIEKASFKGYRMDDPSISFNLYYSELLPLNNNVIIKTNNKKVLFSPYSNLKYYLIEDLEFIDNFENFISKHLRLSTLLSKASVKEHIMFFKPKYLSIKKVKARLDLLRQFPIK